jgi:PAS domain S-box-containing protein
MRFPAMRSRLILRQFFFLIVFGLWLAACSPTLTPTVQPSITRLRVVMDNHYPPYVFEDENGTLRGILIDQWQLWEARTGVKVEITALPWGQALARMKAGEFDVIDTIFYTAERAKILAFTPAYAKINVRIYFQKNITGLATAEDLKGFRVAVKEGDANADYLLAQGVKNLVYYDSYEKIVAAAERQEESIFVMDEPPAMYYLYKGQAGPDFSYSEPLYNGEFHRAVPIDRPDLLNLVTGGFRKITPAEDQAIHDRWLGSRHASFWEAFIFYLWIGISGLALLSLALFVFNRTLRRQVAKRTAELEQALADLGKSEAHFRSAIELLPIPIGLATQDGQVLMYNRAFTQNYGYELADIPTIADWTARAYPDLAYREQVLAIWNQDVARGIETESATPLREYQVTCKDGRQAQVEISMHSLGEIAVSAFNNVTERKRSEAALRESEANYRSLVELSPDGIIVHRSGKVVFANPAALRLVHAHQPDDILGKSALDFVHPDQRGLVAQRIRDLSEEGLIAPVMEERFICLDGVVIDVEVVAMSIRYEGQPAIQVIIRDISERKEMMDSLRVSEEQYRTLIETVNVGIFVSTLEGKFLQANSAVCEMAGYTQDEFLKLSAQALYAEDIERGQMIYELQARGFVKNLEVLSLKKDGSQFWISLSAVLLRNAEGKPLRILGSVADITERKHAAEALQQSERRFRTLIEHSADALTLLNADGTVFYEGPTVRRLTGYSAVERLGRNAFETIFPEDLPFVKQTLLGIMEKPEASVTAQFRAVRSDGSVWWAEGTATNLLHDPSLHAIVINYHDISERKRAEESLLESEQRYRALFEQASDAIFVETLLDDRIVDINHRACEMLGYSRKELLRLHVSDIIAPEVAREPLAIRKELEIYGQKPFESLDLCKDGRRIPVEVTNAQISETLALSIVRDITRRKEFEAQLQQREAEVRSLNAELERRVTERTAQLEQANHELEAFSYSVSHDLRAPLRAIDGFSRIVLDDHAGQLDLEARRLLGHVRDESRHMTQLIEALLGLSRMSRVEMRRELVDLSDLAAMVLETLHQTQPERQVETQIAPGLKAQGDARLLLIVFENLLGNAWKFTSKREQAKIEFGAETREQELVYFIRDNGAGFEMSYAGKLFGVFQRLHNSEEFEGTGIGLTTVQRIVHRHGGRIWGEAEVERGATFYFTLG